MLYQGRYLICHYAKDGVLDGVFDNAKELKEFLNKKGQMCSIDDVHSNLSNIFHGRLKSRKIAFVDALEIHDDDFHHEDDVFVKEMLQFVINRNVSAKQKAKDMGISTRSYFRKMSVFRKQRQEEEMSR